MPGDILVTVYTNECQNPIVCIQTVQTFIMPCNSPEEFTNLLVIGQPEVSHSKLG